MSLQSFLADNRTKVKPPHSVFARGTHVVAQTNSHNIYVNLATEEALLRGLVLDVNQVLFLWYVNHQPCVVMGRNQNAIVEVSLRAAQRDGVAVARRGSGGGTVYHDAGNLCLSFLTHRRAYAPERTIQLLRHGLANLFAMDLTRLQTTARHDLFLDGRKITGSAMRVQGDIAMHHCTLLVDSPLASVGRYLKSEAVWDRYQSAGTASVSAPVTTLAARGLLDSEMRNKVSHVQRALSQFFVTPASEEILRHAGALAASDSGAQSMVCSAVPPVLSARDIITLDVASVTQTVEADSHSAQTPQSDRPESPADVVMLVGEGRKAGGKDSATLLAEVHKLRSTSWLLAMPSFTTRVTLSEDELCEAIQQQPRWQGILQACRRDNSPAETKQQAVRTTRRLTALTRSLFDRVAYTDDAEAEARVARENGCNVSVPARSNTSTRTTLCVHTTICHGIVKNVSLRLLRPAPESMIRYSATVTCTPSHTAPHESKGDLSDSKRIHSCPTGVVHDLAWLNVGLSGFLVEQPFYEPVVGVEDDAPTSGVVYGMIAEAQADGIACDALHPFAEREEAMRLLVRAILHCWRHKNVFDLGLFRTTKN